MLASIHNFSIGWLIADLAVSTVAFASFMATEHATRRRLLWAWLAFAATGKLTHIDAAYESDWSPMSSQPRWRLIAR